MRSYGIRAELAPATWTDDSGITRRTPQVIGRLRSTCPGHAAHKVFIVRRDGHCMDCGSTDRLVADHILSRRLGGAHHPSNMQALCESCNARKACLVEGAGGTRAA